MNRNSKTDQRKKSGSGGDGEEEVDSLLRAAEDELLLNLTVNSHTSRGHHIDPDLDRRFQALKTTTSASSSRTTTNHNKATPPQPPSPSPSPSKPQPRPTKATPADDDDDLLARFAALKGSLPTSSSSSSSFRSNCANEQSNRRTVASDDGVDQDEVQKLIQWAIDAARLDPSPPTDSDADSTHDDSDDDDGGFSSDDGHSNDRQKKGERKKGQKSN